VIANFIVQLVWMIQYYITTAIIWLFSFMLSFEWVSWLATPFNALATWMQASCPASLDPVRADHRGTRGRRGDPVR
jgi:hypothetical protein